MAFLDDLLSIPGAQAWLGSLLNNTSNPRSDLLGAINTGGYSAAGPQTTFNERYSPATDNPLQAQPEATLPPGATPTAANKPLVPAPTQPQIAQAVAPQAAPAPTQQSLQQLYPQIFQGQQNTGIGDRLSAGLRNLGSEQQMLPGIVNAIQGFTTGQRTDPLGVAQQNMRQTAIAVTQHQLSQGVPIQQAIAAGAAASQDPKIAEELLSRYKGMEEKIANAPSGPGGNQDAMQQYNEFKRQQAANEALGKSQGGQAANIENSKAILDQSLSQIDTIKKHPGLESAIGPLAGRAPAIAGDQAAVVNMIDQLSGQIVTNVMQSFKNTGIRLNLQEVQQLQKGASRVVTDRITNVPNYNRALDDLYSQIAGLRSRLGPTAGQAETPSPQGPRAVQSNAPVAINRQTGQRITLKNGQWVPLQ